MTFILNNLATSSVLSRNLEPAPKEYQCQNWRDFLFLLLKVRFCIARHSLQIVKTKMETNGLSLYNVATSLDFNGLTQGGSQDNHLDEDESDEGEEEEIQQRNAEVCHMNYIQKSLLLTLCIY